MAEAFLHAGEDGPIVARFDIDDPVGNETGLSQCRGKKIGAAQAPENLPGTAGCNTCAEQCCRRPIDRSISATSNLMESTDSQSASWQATIDRRDAKRQNFSSARTTPLESLDLVAQGLKHRLWPQLEGPAVRWKCSLYVLIRMPRVNRALLGEILNADTWGVQKAADVTGTPFPASS